jgi:hypothetical protein
VTVASFDTTEDAIEGLAADLGVTGLPQFRFYKVGLSAWVELGGWMRCEGERGAVGPSALWCPAVLWGWGQFSCLPPVGLAC